MNFKPIIYFSCILLSFFGCNTKSQTQNQNQIDFGKNQGYLVTKNEKSEVITKEVLADYEALIYPFVNLPLNRYIVTDKETIFIGVSFDLKPNQILKKFKERGKRTFEKEDSNDMESNFLEPLKKDNYAYYHLYHSKKDNLTFLLIFVDKNKDYIYSLYKNTAFINKKIRKK